MVDDAGDEHGWVDDADCDSVVGFAAVGVGGLADDVEGAPAAVEERVVVAVAGTAAIVTEAGVIVALVAPKVTDASWPRVLLAYRDLSSDGVDCDGPVIGNDCGWNCCCQHCYLVPTAADCFSYFSFFGFGTKFSPTVRP